MGFEQHHQDSHGAHAAQHAHLFTLRLWEEQLGDGKAEWRGRVQDIPSGEAHYFRDWSGLVELLARLVNVEPAAIPADQIRRPLD